jgi:hypothetical protein
MRNLLKEAVHAGMTYVEYNRLFKQLVKEGKTTGEISEEKIKYTRLNFSRTKRLDKTVSIQDFHSNKINHLNAKQIWLIISESWCGDAAQTLPILNKISLESNNIDLKIVLRDEYPELMNAFLTNGSQAIPKLIILDEDLEVIQSWGPRSRNAAQLVTEYKYQYGKVDDELKKKLQIWYNQDHGKSIINEIVDIIENTSLNIVSLV